jgi:hypothetical protein
MHPHLLAKFSVSLLAAALAAQAPEPQHLLRLTLSPGTTHYYRKCVATERKFEGKVTDSENQDVTLECSVGTTKEGKADLQQTVRRLVYSVDSKVTYDSEEGGKDDSLVRWVGAPVTMKMDARGCISDLKLPDAVTKELSPSYFLVHTIPMPELPVAVGKTWESSVPMPFPVIGDREVKCVSKLATVTRGRATIETEVADAEQRVLKAPIVATFDKYRLTTVIELATGRLVESHSECLWSIGLNDTRKHQFRVTETIEAIALPAPKPSSAPTEPKPAHKV